MVTTERHNAELHFQQLSGKSYVPEVKTTTITTKTIGLCPSNHFHWQWVPALTVSSCWLCTISLHPAFWSTHLVRLQDGPILNQDGQPSYTLNTASCIVPVRQVPKTPSEDSVSWLWRNSGHTPYMPTRSKNTGPGFSRTPFPKREI